jgi:hypothetical protein
MPKYPAIDQMMVPVQVPKTTNSPANREPLIDVCKVMKRLGPGVITATPQIDTTLRINKFMFISICPAISIRTIALLSAKDHRRKE